MARSELRSNQKFKRLMHRLRLPAPYVMGLLECMWQCGYASGNDLLGDADDVEIAAEWPGEPGMFFKAMFDEHWIDERNGQFHIHDLFDNAPEYVKKRMHRRASEKAETTQNKDLQRKTADNGRHSAPKLDKRRQFSPNGISTQPNPTQPTNTGRLSTDACGEPASAASPPPSADFPLFNCIPGRRSQDRTWLLTDAHIAELSTTFPGVDVPAECRKAWGWLRANGTKRKTSTGMPEYLYRWMSRCQDKAGSSALKGPSVPSSNYEDPTTQARRVAAQMRGST